MNIAICDNDRLMSGQIENLVNQVFHGETSKFNTEIFIAATTTAETPDGMETVEVPANT